MSEMKKPEVEFVMFDVVDTIQTSNNIVCTTEYCNLQGCPKDDCSNFDW